MFNIGDRVQVQDHYLEVLPHRAGDVATVVEIHSDNYEVRCTFEWDSGDVQSYSSIMYMFEPVGEVIFEI